jgi:2,4-dienoyl-CoA reductase-like NADH-dependent reductase (Old Yellow Enzyme family)/thioredoxin reductase
MEKLLQEFSIRSLRLRNRMVLPTLDPGFAGEGGRMTPRLIHYFVRRARGGVSFIMVGPAVFDPVGSSGTFEYRIDRNEILEGLSRLVKEIHRCGVPVGLQLHHAGRQANPDLIEGVPVAPSAIPCPVRKSQPRALSIPEIERIIEQYGIFARKAREMGFDAVEVHGSHGYLIAQFLSPFANSRSDSYGGSLENRARLAVQVIREVRRNVGKDFPIFFRLAGEEHVPGGLTVEETPGIARMVEEAGVDVIDVSAGTYRTAEWIVPPMIFPPGCNVYAAQAIKEKVGIPVLVAGRINGPELAEQILQEGKADLISMARGLVADPDLPQKVREGRVGEIRRCIACNECIDRLFQEQPIECTVNPEVGREEEFKIIPAPRPKKVMIIGGGPAGMEAARVARMRGHRVTLWEKEDRLGGRIEAASQTSFKGELKSIPRYYEAVLKALQVEVKLSTPVNPERVRAFNPETIVIATGSIPSLPPIAGAHLSHVVQAEDILLGRVQVEGRVVVIGGGTVGCEVAIFLAEKGGKVTIAEMLSYVAHGIPRLLGKMIKDMMREEGVRILTGQKVVQIKEGGVVCEDSGKGLQTEIPADGVVLAVGNVSRDDLVESLSNLCPETQVIGDCRKPRKALDAIYEGAKAGLQI